MHEPYFPNEQTATEFFYLIGRIIVSWSAVERSVDIILYSSKVFHPKDGTAIISWSVKIKQLRKLFEANPKNDKKWIEATIFKLNDLAAIRNAIIHGYCNGATDSDPPEFIFRANKYQPEKVHTNQLMLTMERLVEYFKAIQDLSETLLGATLQALIHPKGKSQKGD